MSFYSVLAPQLGEGIKAIKVVSVLKAPGDAVAKDEAILEVETEKAVLVIESPVFGIMGELQVALQESVPVGQCLLTIATKDGNSQNTHLDPCQAITFPERTINVLVKASNLISERQRFLIQQMQRSQQQVVPALLQTRLNQSLIKDFRRRARAVQIPALIPSSTEILAWSVLQAMELHPVFHCELSPDGTHLIERDIAIGVAVDLGGGDLATMRILRTEAASFEGFCNLYKQRLDATREGHREDGPHSLTISDLSAFDVAEGIPVIVQPAVATLCIGLIRDENIGMSHLTFSLAFDHRFINGVAAARFLTDMKKCITRLCSNKYVENVVLSAA